MSDARGQTAAGRGRDAVGVQGPVGQRPGIHVDFELPALQIAADQLLGERILDVALDGAAQPKKPLEYYTSSFNTPMGKFEGEAWVDDTGLSVKSILKMPFGVVTAALDKAP